MANKTNGVEFANWARAPPPSGPPLQRILKTIYDPQDKSFLGRTPKRWAIVLVFYAVFYLMLGLLCSICMTVFYKTLDDTRPTYVMDQSLIGANPGVASRPRPDDDGLVVRYGANNASHYEPFVQQLDEFLMPYAKEPWLKSSTECTSADNYGFPETPCVFIKINKIFDWSPECYDDVSALPEDMPQDLVQHINALPEADRKQIWISCAEEKTNTANVTYPWGIRGLPSKNYPYVNQAGFRSPIVAVKVALEANHLTIIRCRAWAKNIRYNKSLKEPSGYTFVQLKMENDTTK